MKRTLNLRWLAVLPLLLSTACAAKGSDAMLKFDQKYQEVLSQTLAQGEVLRRPCPATVDGRDYRYLHCFEPQRGSGTSIHDHLIQTFEKVGFVQERNPAQGNDLDTLLRLPGTPYSVNIYFTSSGIQWHALQDGVGKIPAFMPQQVKAPYALTNPEDAARMMGMTMLYHVKVPLRDLQGNRIIQPCGETGKDQASVCLTWTGQKNALRDLVLQEFFAGEERWFAPLDKKGTYEYRQEPLYQEMVAAGTVGKDAKSPMLLRKISDGRYILRDTAAWPGYEFEFTGLKADQVRVTANLVGAGQP